ncbi:hypothetical protein Tco_0245998 [Tanacetum coccineum]
MFDRANTEHSTLKRLSMMDKYLAEFDTDLRSEIKGQHALRRNVCTLEDQVIRVDGLEWRIRTNIAVILIDKRLVRLIDVTVEQWLDLKYGNHKTMDKNIKKGVIGTWLIRSYKLQFEEYLEIKRQRDTYTREVDMEYYLFNLVFTEWLATKSYNHLDMDWYTKKVYRMRGDDEVILSNEEVSDLKDTNNNDEHEIAEIFRIETNLFDYETPLCMEFKELNYLFKVDAELFTHNIKRTKTYEDYESELNNKDNEPWSEDEVSYELYGFCNGRELSGMVQVGHMTYFQDYEWNGKSSKNSDVQEKEEEHKERCDFFDNTTHNAMVCNIRIFKMIKYSFRQDEEYVAIKEYEYDDLT